MCVVYIVMVSVMCVVYIAMVSVTGCTYSDGECDGWYV